MFDLSFEGYLNWIEKLRAEVIEDPSEYNIPILAKVLCDCAFQCDRDEAEKHGLLWEAIYWCLHLYYTYGKEEFLARARSIDRYKNLI